MVNLKRKRLKTWKNKIKISQWLESKQFMCQQIMVDFWQISIIFQNMTKWSKFSNCKTQNISEIISMKRITISMIRIRKCGNKIASLKFHLKKAPLGALEKEQKRELISFVGSTKWPTWDWECFKSWSKDMKMLKTTAILDLASSSSTE